MPSPAAFAAFAVASLALLVVPGPSVLYIVTRSVQGRAAGLVSVLGIHTGSIVHVLAAALGVSAILASSALAFGVVKYAGAAYLIWHEGADGKSDDGDQHQHQNKVRSRAGLHRLPQQRVHSGGDGGQDSSRDRSFHPAQARGRQRCRRDVVDHKGRDEREREGQQCPRPCFCDVGHRLRHAQVQQRLEDDADAVGDDGCEKADNEVKGERPDVTRPVIAQPVVSEYLAAPETVHGAKKAR